MKYIIIVAIILLVSCRDKRLVLDNQILLPVPVEKTTGEFFFSNFELENIVPIDTTNEFLLSGIFTGVIFHKNKLIIADKRTTSIYVIDANTGNVETHIYHKGGGPGESNYICDIAFDDHLEQIIVFNDYKKLLYFGLDGSFIKEEKITDNLFDHFTYHNDKLIFYNTGEGYACYPYRVNIYNLLDKSWKQTGKDKKVEFPHRGYGRLLVKSKNIWFTPVLDFGLYLLNDDKIESPYMLDQKPINNKMRQKSISDIPSFYREVGERSIMYSINSVRETENFIVFNSNLYGFFIMNKNETKLYWEIRVKDECLGLELWNYYPHDGDDNRIMFIVDANEWLERMPKDADNIPEHLRANINNLKINEESNPILVFYKEIL